MKIVSAASAFPKHRYDQITIARALQGIMLLMDKSATIRQRTQRALHAQRYRNDK